ncbi:hypothetical protein ABVT39_024329 [Epinephelus coioides]
MARKKELPLETVSLLLCLERKAIQCEKVRGNLKPLTMLVTAPLREQHKLALTRTECKTVQEDKYLRVCSLRQRRLTGPQLAAALHSTSQTPVEEKAEGSQREGRPGKGDYEKGVDHLTNAIAVCGQPQQLLQVLQQTLPPPVFQMLLTKLPGISQMMMTEIINELLSHMYEECLVLGVAAVQ